MKHNIIYLAPSYHVRTLIKCLTLALTLNLNYPGASPSLLLLQRLHHQLKYLASELNSNSLNIGYILSSGGRC